ncbi:ricin-type beta-trefoil lectin domain protein [Kitasatospora sp. NPDC097691]|uniref:ricin-type beta-trefoil lectin domain protein n=1 Tax=Kitasatospora sp. NPDC097691 TaxID=3157231 RepID=UPI00332BD492
MTTRLRLRLRLRLPRHVVALAAALLIAVSLIPLTATGARAATPICISGAFQYDYQSAEDGTAKPTRTKPLRNANVELWGAEGNEDGHSLGVWGFTGVDDGSFNLCYTPTTTTSLRVVWAQAWSQSSRLWRVLDYNAQYYTLQSPTYLHVTASRNVGTTKPPAATARAWHAFDTINPLWWYRANPASICWSAHELDNNNCTELNIYWADGNDKASYDPDYNQLILAGTVPDSEHTVLHEAGHFLMNRLYNGMFPKSDNCSSHYIPTVSSETCAWTEGFADSVAAYVLGDNRYVFSNGTSTEFTYGNGWQVGDQVQGNVDGSLLDLWRNVDGDWDRSIAAITAKQPATFSAYFNTVRPAANPPLATGSAALAPLARHTIDYGPTIIGDGKYHSLTNGSGLALERYGSCSATSGANASLGTLDTTRSWQRWKVDANPDGTARISDGCTQPLTLTAPSSTNGAVTLKAFDQANGYQKWQITKANGTLRLTNPQTGWVLDSTSITVGATAVAKPPSGANSQSWAPLA